MTVVWFGGILSFLIGLVLTSFGSVTFFRQRRKNARMAHAHGVVTGLVRVSDGNNNYFYCPQVQFQTAAGQIFSFQSNIGVNPATHRVGRRVKVLYDPLNPAQNAQINSFFALWLPTLVYLLSGTIFAFVGFIFIILGAALALLL